MPRYSDETLKDIYKNATETLEWQGDRMQFEDALQCIIFLAGGRPPRSTETNQGAGE